MCQKISCSTLVWEIEATRNKFLNVSACFSNLRMVFAKTLEWIVRGKTLTHDFSHAYVECYHVIFVNKK